jgi:DNA-binding MarR family transcriptional regulator
MNRYVPLVREFAARVVLFHESIAEKVGLNATDLKVLRLLGETSMTAGQLAEHIGLTAAAVTALVDRLEAAGYATRERDEVDRRRVTVRALPAKMKKIDRLYEAYGAEMTKILAGYDAKEYAAIEDFLARTTKLLTEQTIAVRERVK